MRLPRLILQRIFLAAIFVSLSWTFSYVFSKVDHNSHASKAYEDDTISHTPLKDGKLSPDANNPSSKMSNFEYVDPRIGTEGGGHVWVGSTVPHGMVKVSVDSDHNEGGYSPVQPIIGISHTHVSGTGGGRSYQNMVLTPHWAPPHSKGHLVRAKENAYFLPDFLLSPKERNVPLPEFSSTRSNETATIPGFYATTLNEPGIHIEMTSAHTFAKHKWSFVPSEVAKSQSLNGGKVSLNTLMKVRHPSMNFISGSARVDKGRVMVTGEYIDFWSSWYEQKRDHAIYRVYSCMSSTTDHARYGAMNSGEFSKPQSILQVDKNMVQKAIDIKTKASHEYSHGETILENVGAYLSFDFDAEIKERVYLELSVGISFHSMNRACQHLESAERESFEEVKRKNMQAWNTYLRSDSIHVHKPILRPEDTTIFYSSLYRIFLMPTNRTSENPTWASTDIYFDDYYCIWDTFRTFHPLLTLIHPNLQAQLINSLLNSAKHENGFLGDCHVGNAFGITQGGNNAEILIAEAYVKNLSGIDFDKAFDVIKKGTESESTLGYMFEGRGDVDHYNQLGYVPQTNAKSSSVSRNLEYSYSDFTIAQMAKGMGREDEYRRYISRSGNWKILWDPETENRGFTGFMQPRARGEEGNPGNFLRMSVTVGSTIDHIGEVTQFYEDSSWAYSFYAPHDMKTLINLMGGEEVFVKRLDAFFEAGLYNAGNEPAFLIPVLYHYTGNPNLSVKRVDAIIGASFTAKPDGVPGNDDAASMAAWYIFAAMGLFPVAGQDIYLILAPRFEQVEMAVNSGSKRFKIVAHNATLENRTVKSVTLNGKELKRAWLLHHELVNGGQLDLFLSADVSTGSMWGSERPPSYLSQ